MIKPESTITIPYRNKLNYIAYKEMAEYSSQVANLNN